MQKRTSPLKFGDLADTSGFNPVSDLSTEVLKDEYRKCDRELAKGAGAPRGCVLQSAPQAAELFFCAARAGRLAMTRFGRFDPLAP